MISYSVMQIYCGCYGQEHYACTVYFKIHLTLPIFGRNKTGHFELTTDWKCFTMELDAPSIYGLLADSSVVTCT